MLRFLKFCFESGLLSFLVGFSGSGSLRFSMWFSSGFFWLSDSSFIVSFFLSSKCWEINFFFGSENKLKYKTTLSSFF